MLPKILLNKTLYANRYLKRRPIDKITQCEKVCRPFLSREKLPQVNNESVKIFNILLYSHNRIEINTQVQNKWKWFLK